MALRKIFYLLFLFPYFCLSQVENDTIVNIEDEIILLEEVFINGDSTKMRQRKEYLLLQNRVLKVYPFARTAAERLVVMDRHLAQLTTEKEKKRYIKLVEKYIEDEFEKPLKKLSRKQGQILVKLIYRQTDQTTFDLIRHYKNGWKAFWFDKTAKVFDIDLKKKYAPWTVNEDYLIESVLERAFERGRLQRQDPATPIDTKQLHEHWYRKAAEQEN